VFVTSRKFDKSLRILPFNQTLDEDGEALLMRHVCNVPRKSLWQCKKANSTAIGFFDKLLLRDFASYLGFANKEITKFSRP
jgi:hypothetical protein